MANLTSILKGIYQLLIVITTRVSYHKVNDYASLPPTAAEIQSACVFAMERDVG